LLYMLAFCDTPHTRWLWVLSKANRDAAQAQNARTVRHNALSQAIWVKYSSFQTFAVFCMLYVFFWVIPRRLKFYMLTFRNTLSVPSS
jgi:hypothetical protein